jgi:hypothetical protein
MDIHPKDDPAAAALSRTLASAGSAARTEDMSARMAAQIRVNAARLLNAGAVPSIAFGFRLRLATGIVVILLIAGAATMLRPPGRGEGAPRPAAAGVQGDGHVPVADLDAVIADGRARLDSQLQAFHERYGIAVAPGPSRADVMLRGLTVASERLREELVDVSSLAPEGARDSGSTTGG